MILAQSNTIYAIMRAARRLLNLIHNERISILLKITFSRKSPKVALIAVMRKVILCLNLCLKINHSLLDLYDGRLRREKKRGRKVIIL